MKLTKDAFIPSQDNDYTPHLLQRAALMGMASLILLTFLAANLQAILWQSSNWLVGAVLPAVVVTLTNEERADEALPELRRNEVLDVAARLKAEDMAQNSYFAHYSPTGVSPWYWFEEAGYVFANAGENLAVHFSDSHEVVTAWMKSPTHRANIVNANFTEIGVGTARGRYEGYDTVFVVQLFGTPAAGNVSPVATGLVPNRLTNGLESTSATDVVVATNSAPKNAETIAMTTDVSSSEPAEEIAGAEIELANDVGDVASTETVATATPAVAHNETDSTTLVSESLDPIVPERLVVADTVVTDEGIAIVSDTIATTSGLAPIPVAATAAPRDNPGLVGLLTSSQQLMWWLYVSIGSIVVGLLLTSIFIEWREQRMRHVWYGVALLLGMSILFYIHTVVTSGATIL